MVMVMMVMPSVVRILRTQAPQGGTASAVRASAAAMPRRGTGVISVCEAVVFVLVVPALFALVADVRHNACGERAAERAEDTVVSSLVAYKGTRRCAQRHGAEAAVTFGTWLAWDVVVTVAWWTLCAGGALTWCAIRRLLLVCWGVLLLMLGWILILVLGWAAAGMGLLRRIATLLWVRRISALWWSSTRLLVVVIRVGHDK